MRGFHSEDRVMARNRGGKTSPHNVKAVARQNGSAEVCALAQRR